MALDLGEKYLGIAMSDPTGRIAFPHRTVARRGIQKDIAFLLGLVKEEGVEAIVVGLPLSLSGAAGAEAQKALEFCRRLAQATSLPVETWDERLSTVAAQRRLAEVQPPSRKSQPKPRRGGAAGDQGRRRRIDALAAAVVLQSYLDARAREAG